ncbi:archaea-specific SMC-related protein [Halalkalicoccus sp. GCM10025322]|uniref:archaea-specific SMC-related protein n=1 Tax=Halalkalicoccus TaxID=332246 RepID=UPI002F96B558
MSSEQIATEAESVQVEARNIGGISETTVEFEPGVTILAGRNATNRTSLLRAIMLALGSEETSLKADADHGEVKLSIGEETYSRTMTRQGDSVVVDGNPYLEDAEAADLFAFLLEDNEARRAVARGDDLREIIMRPIDTEEIKAEIERLNAERREIDERLEEIQEEERRLPELEERKAELTNRIEEKKAELETAEADLESLDGTVEESREDKEELESKLDDLRETRGELDRVRERIETENRSIESLEDEREDVKSNLNELEGDADVDATSIDQDVERLRERKRTIDSMMGELQNIIQFNEEMLEGDRNDVRSALDQGEKQGGAVTDQLVDSTTVCWTCGSEVQTDQIETTLDQLRQFRREKLETIREIEDELDELRTERREREQRQRRRENLENRLRDIDDEIEQRRDRKDDLQNEQAELERRLEDLETEVETLQSEEFEGILEQHREANQIEFEINRLNDDLERVGEEIETIESELEEQDDLKAQREEVKAALVDVRTRIDQIEERAVEQFNTHMETVLDLLDYGNLDRIWIERVERQVREGRRKVDRTQFELHIVRTNENGTAYEDTIDHLSESEREVTGLVFALAGYLANEVYETLPLIILDSLEAVDSDRISALVDYFSDYTDYSVIALLPEDEQALDQSYRRIREI